MTMPRTYVPRFDRLEKERLPNWSWERCWTSDLRHKAGHTHFDHEKDHTDFTYQDENGAMRRVLQRWGVPIQPEWSDSATYHLEVKATRGHCKEMLWTSPNQVDKVRLEASSNKFWYDL